MLFLDTSGLLRLIDRRDPRGAEAVTLFGAVSVRVTHTAVVVELVALAESRGVARRQVLDFIDRLHTNQTVEVVQVDSHLYDEGRALLRRRLDKAWSLCDAISFILMNERGLTEALTTDHHFEQAGFTRLLTA